MANQLTPIEQYVADFVLKLRKDRKMTQADIGVIIGTSDRFVGALEDNRTGKKYNLNHIDALADYFDMNPGDFLPKKSTKKVNQ